MVSVIAVIAILAGILLGAAGYAQKKGMASRTQATIHQLCVALDMRRADLESYPPDYKANWLGPVDCEIVWPCEALWYWLSYYYTSQAYSGKSHAKEPYIKFRADQLQDGGKLVATKQDNYMRVVDAWGNPINYKSVGGSSYWFDTTGPGESRSWNYFPRHNRRTYDLCSYGANGNTWQDKDKPFDRARDLNKGGGSSSRPPDYFFKPFDTLGGSKGHCFGGEDGDDINNWQQR